ncbi:DUF4259 domain-containing protein [Lewinella sp. IMCC34183]|uniref:DUF4259 domain-containing protein n=1 Tax=Lewinella sp. IMCC34183 TaxID=2248762 RepID=UPI000E26CC90|nr:DUF4259 domain-containing protein [Lewinella sp. IMCC34183]
MGAWDYGIFDDDTAYDFLDDIAEDPQGFLTAAFERAGRADYLEYDDGVAALVAAAYLDNLLSGTSFRNDNEDLQDITNVNRFRERYAGPPLDHLAAPAAAAVRAVRTGDSELQGLWEENEELYPLWVRQLEEMEARLDGGE